MRAQELVRGAYDTHVHVAPDVVRAQDRRRLAGARARASSGWPASCSSPTTAAPPSARPSCAQRSRVCRRSARSRSTARSAGSIRWRSRSPRARARAPSGCRPSTRSTRRRSARHRPGPRSRCGSGSSSNCASGGSRSSPCRCVDAGGRVLPETREVLALIARHGMVLATGHLGREEIFAVVDAALEEGVSEIVVTHPEFPSQNLSIDDQQALAQRGARARALLHDAAHRQDQLGAVDRRDPRDRSGEHGPVDRSRPGVQPAGRGRAGD